MMTTDLDRHLTIDLTTVGRAPRCPHTIEIWFAPQGRSLCLLSGGGTSSDWVRNLTRTPGVRVHVDADEYAARFIGDFTPWRENALPIAVELDPAETG